MNSPCRRFDLLFSPCWFNLSSLLTTLTARVLVRRGPSITSESGVTAYAPFHSIETCARMALRDSLMFFAYKKMVGRTETRTHDRIYCQTMRTVRDDRAIIATCSLRTLTDRQKDFRKIIV